MLSTLRRVLQGGPASADAATPAGYAPRPFPARVREFEATYDPASGGWIPAPGEPIQYASVEMEVGHLWHALVMLLRPTRILETGTHRGYSTCCIASALRDLERLNDGVKRELLTIDPAPLVHLWEGTELERLIRWIPSESTRCAEQVAREFAGKPFDMLVLDSDHSYSTIIFELEAFEPLLRPGGAILLHDSLFYDGVGAAVTQVQQNPRFSCVTLDSPRTHADPTARHPGITIIRKHEDGEPRLRRDERFAGLGNGGWSDEPFLWKARRENPAQR